MASGDKTPVNITCHQGVKSITRIIDRENLQRCCLERPRLKCKTLANCCEAKKRSKDAIRLLEVADHKMPAAVEEAVEEADARKR